MNRQQLEQYLGNPHVRKMLDVIASSEGVKHGYNTLFGNEKFDGLVSHPNIRKQFKQTDGKVNYTTAAGRYQFLNSTWNDVARQYGLKSFSPINQDLAAIALIARRGALNDVVKGNYQSAIHKLGEEWASLPTSRYAQGKRSWGDINKMLGSTQHEVASQQQRAPILGNWKDFAGAQKRLPAKKLNDFTTQTERMPITGNWSDLIDENRGGGYGSIG